MWRLLQELKEQQLMQSQIGVVTSQIDQIAQQARNQLTGHMLFTHDASPLLQLCSACKKTQQAICQLLHHFADTM